MKIIEKRFQQGQPYSENGDIYYKPLAKFVKFGTSGVRWLVKDAAKLLKKDRIDYYLSNGYCRNMGGVNTLAEDFILPNVGVVISAIALYCLNKTPRDILSEKGLLVTYDNRPGNFIYAEEAAKILASYGIKAILAKSGGKYIPTPLPAGSRMVKRLGLAGQITFTASHNGDEWNGVKFEGSDGGAALPGITDVICSILIEELALNDNEEKVSYQAANEDLNSLIRQGKCGTIDILEFYVKEISSYLNTCAIKKAVKKGKVEFIYSAFYGSSGPAILKLFENLDLATKNIIETAKGVEQGYITSYEPTLERLKKFGDLLRDKGRKIRSKDGKRIILGGAADNDADRFQVSQYNPDVKGEVEEYPPGKLAAILCHYLYKYRRFKGPSGRSFVSSSLQDGVAKLFRQNTIETPTGFKYSPLVFGKGGILFSEESYGLSFKDWTLDKDGILPSLLALELVAVTGKSLGEYYRDILDELSKAGFRSRVYFKRYDMPLDRGVKEEAIKRFTEFFNEIQTGTTSLAGQTISKAYDPKEFEGGMKFILANKSWIAMRSSGTEPLIRLYVEGSSEGQNIYLREAAMKLMGLAAPSETVTHKLHTPLKALSADSAPLFLKGGYNQPGYGVPEGASIDGSFAIDGEGDQGYFVNGGREIFLNNAKCMRDFFKRRAERLNKKIRYVIKPGIGGQHTPFQGVADIFHIIDAGKGTIAGEYELGKDYEKSLASILNNLGAGWNEIAVIPSSKSGSTDETMMIFTEIFYLLLKNIAAEEGFDGALFADTVFISMREVNFVNGVERSGKDLFKGFSLKLVQNNLEAKKVKVAYEKIKKIFGVVLGNMFFETTDRPQQSRLSALIRNSELAKELDPSDMPGFGAMFDNVGGRWTADLHMMTFLAYHELDAEAYWRARYEGIREVRDGKHAANFLADKILNEEIKDIAMVVPDAFFWFGKAMEQNFNESIWQNGFTNLIAIKESTWAAQRYHYSRKPGQLVINMSGKNIPGSIFNVINLEYADPKKADKQKLAETIGELFTTFYGVTQIIGNALIAKAVSEKGYSAEDIDINDLDNPATKILQQNLYLRQPYVELGKGLLEKRLSELQSKGSKGIEKELKRIKMCAHDRRVESNIDQLRVPGKIANGRELAKVIKRAIDYAKNTNRKFVPFIYLEGEKFSKLRDHLIRIGIEWVMQGTGDQHISYQQVLAQPARYLPFIISFIPDEALPGRPAIGFAKGYLDNVSPNMARDLFAEASYRALTSPRKSEAGEDIKGALGIFLRMTDSDKDRGMLAQSFPA